MSELHEIDLDTSVRQGYEGYSDFYELASDAIDRASDQGQRTAVRYGGKVIAYIVTAEDGDRLERMEPLCICPPRGDWLDECPRHGQPAEPCAATQAYGATGCT